MASEVINLLSSDIEPEGLSSSAPAAVESFQSNDFVVLSDDIDFPASKRQRLTPPRSRSKVAISTGREVLSSAEKVQCLNDSDRIHSRSSSALPVRRSFGLADSRNQQPVDIFEDDLDTSPQPAPAVRMQFSSRTTALLAELDTNRVASQRAGSRTTSIRQSKPFTRAKTTIPPVSSIEDPSPLPEPPVRRRPGLTTPEREQRAREKAEKKETTKAQKAAERAAKRAAKQQEKQLVADLAEVNRARSDKKLSVSEMILQMSETFFERNIGRLTEDVHKQLGVQVERHATRLGDAFDNVLVWKRKVKAKFDEEAGHWVPLERPEIRVEEGHVLCMLEAPTFVRMVQREMASEEAQVQDIDWVTTDDSTDKSFGLDAYIRLMRRRWTQARPIFLIEALEAFMRKSKNSRNRIYQAAARSKDQDDPVASSSHSTVASSRRKTKQRQETIVDDGMVEEALLTLQVEHGCLIHHTSSAPETAEWIGHFTQHVSTIPYKNQPVAAEASFCMDTGQVRTGTDEDETYEYMLQEIVRVTAPVAFGIIAQYPTLVSLIKAMRREGPLLLEDLKKGSNRNGGLTNARIGPALSKRIYKVFMGEDADSMDI